jgi:dipeptide/tripeptide permease
MDLRYGDGSSQINGTVLNIGDCAAIIICIPLFDSYVYPLVERCKGSPFSPHQKIGCGFITAFLAMVIASAIEIERRKAPVLTGEDALSNCAAEGVYMSDISVFWMIVPIFLIGVSECLISVQLYDLCYSEVPAELRSTAQALNLFMTALSGAITAAVTTALSDYEPADLNDGECAKHSHRLVSLASWHP